MLKLAPLNLVATRFARPECTYRGFEFWRVQGVNSNRYIIRYIGLATLVNSLSEPSRGSVHEGDLLRLITRGSELRRMCFYATDKNSLPELKKGIIADLIAPNAERARQGCSLSTISTISILEYKHSCYYAGFEIWQYEPTGEYVLRYTDFGHPAVVTTHAEIPRMCYLATGLRSLMSVKEFIKTKIRNN